MATPTHGYEPSRMSSLAWRTTEAIESLSSISSTDPAAGGAVTAVRGLQSTLQNRWVPAVSAVLSVDPLGRTSASTGPGGRSGTWEYVVGQGVVFVPFDALDALFPGDDDITAEDIVAKIEEILDEDPSEQQLLELTLLGRAFDEIATDTVLSEAVLVELGADGVESLYQRLFVLGAQYPINPSEGTVDFDPDLGLGSDLADLILGPFNDVVASGSRRPDGAAVVSEVIANGREESYDFWLAPILALAQADGLPLDLQHELLDTLVELHDRGIERSPWAGDNVVFPDHRSFDGSIEAVVIRIIEQTPEGELVVHRPGGPPTGSGVIFDLAAILAETDIDVHDVALLTAMAPYFADLSGGLPGVEAATTPQQYRALLKNLLEDLPPDQVEHALGIIAAAAIERIDDVLLDVHFRPGESPAHILRGLLDGVFGPLVGALKDIHGDEKAAAEQLAWVLNSLAGLAPTPESRAAALAISVGVGWTIGRITDVGDADDDVVTQAKTELVASAIIGVYQVDHLRRQVERTALDEWDSATKDKLRGLGWGDDEIARFERELEHAVRTGEPLAPDVFVSLPDIVELTEVLGRELELSPAESASE